MGLEKMEDLLYAYARQEVLGTIEPLIDALDEAKDAIVISHKVRNKDDSERRWQTIRGMYQVNRDEWNVQFERQQGCCAICGRSQKDLGYCLQVDHNHHTGNFRGLLCRNCNIGLGQFHDSPELIEKALRYLSI